MLSDRQLSNEPTASCWLPFQTAAGTVTKLYKGECVDFMFDRYKMSSNFLPLIHLELFNLKLCVRLFFFCVCVESCDGMKRSNDLANQVGYQRRNKEIAEWARSKKRRYIRRDDLLSYLAGKPLPPVSAHHHHQFSSNNNNSSTQHTTHNHQVALMWPPAAPLPQTNHLHHNHHHHHNHTGINNNSTRLHQLR